GNAHGAATTAIGRGFAEGGAAVDGAYATNGQLETIRLPDAETLAKQTFTVRRVNARSHPNAPIPSGIKHVIYVVRENKTYDQLFGDIPFADGDPGFTHFGYAVTPNAHHLATDWVLNDRFYYPAEASATGH